MDEKRLDKIMDNMMDLYKKGNIEELVKIRDDKNEEGSKRMAAEMVLQMPRDTRRYS